MARTGRDDAGKSEASFKKHDLLRRVVIAQVAAWRWNHPRSSFVMIDMHGGDGQGVDRPQFDLFGKNESVPTPVLAARMAYKFSGGLILCERDPAKRVSLSKMFPDALVLPDHGLAFDAVRDFKPDHVVVLADPCGPKEQGVAVQREIATAYPSAEFVNVLDTMFALRLEGTNKHEIGSTAQARAWETSKLRYGPMQKPDWWMEQLDRPRMAWSIPLRQSAGFRPRIVVVSHFLAKAARSSQFEVFTLEKPE